MNILCTDVFRNVSGATAVLYAVVALPLLAALGLTFDFSRALSANDALQSSLDAAVLAATHDLADATLSDAQVAARAQSYFTGNLQSASSELVCGLPTTNIDRANFSIVIAAQCLLPTTMSGIVGLADWPLSETARGRANIASLDLSLMVDVSGSMTGTRMDAMRNAAKEAASILIKPENADRVRIAIAPYDTAINLGSFGDAAFGPGFPGEVCASERTGPEAFTDALPGPGAWIETDATTCPSATIKPLSYDLDDIEDAIDHLVPGGMTAGHLGVAWSWYLISPQWRPFWPADSQPRATSYPNMKRAVILMTDGGFNMTYGGTGTSSQQAISLCDAMKAEGILVFSVAFLAPPSGEATLRACATQPDMYYDAGSSAELLAAYQSIASSLTSLYLAN